MGPASQAAGPAPVGPLFRPPGPPSAWGNTYEALSLLEAGLRGSLLQASSAGGFGGFGQQPAAGGFGGFGAAQAGQGGTVSVKWAKTTGPDGAPNTTNNSNGLYMAITAMPAYQNYSFEELRVQDYDAGRKKAQGGFGLGGGGGFGAPAAPANNGFGGGGGSVFGQINQASTPAASAFGAPATGAFGGPAAGAFGATTTPGFGGAFGSTGGGGFGGGSAFGQPAKPAAFGAATGAGGSGLICVRRKLIALRC